MNMVYLSLSSATTPIMAGKLERRFGAALPYGTGCPQSTDSKAAAGYPWSWPDFDLAQARERGEMVHVMLRHEQDIIRSSAERNQRDDITSISANEMRVGLGRITRAAQQAQPDHERQLESQRDDDAWSQRHSNAEETRLALQGLGRAEQQSRPAREHQRETKLRDVRRRREESALEREHSRQWRFGDNRRAARSRAVAAEIAAAMRLRAI